MSLDRGQPAFLQDDEPLPWRVINPAATRPLLFVCEHASAHLPVALQGAYPAPLMATHYACDIGSLGLVTGLANRLNARAVVANYSRIVIDCNRRLEDPTLLLPVADGEPVAANTGLTRAEFDSRVESIYAPFHAEVERQMRSLTSSVASPVYIAIHSFTPLHTGTHRPWDMGVMWDVDDRLALRLCDSVSAEASLKVGANEPYSGKNVADFSVDYHAERNGFANVAIEVRQDHLLTDDGIALWIDRLADALAPLVTAPDLTQPRQVTEPLPEFVQESVRFSKAAKEWSSCNAR